MLKMLKNAKNALGYNIRHIVSSDYLNMANGSIMKENNIQIFQKLSIEK